MEQKKVLRYGALNIYQGSQHSNIMSQDLLALIKIDIEDTPQKFAYHDVIFFMCQ